MKFRYLAASWVTVVFGLAGASSAVADTQDVPELSHVATLAEAAVADITVSSSEALAGEELSVLILDDDADVERPAPADIVFIEQYELDDAGAVDFRVQLPTEALQDYDIALNTAAGTERYVASLDGENIGEGEDPGEVPTDEPDDEPTTDPDDGSPADGTTPEPDDEEGTADGGPTDGGEGTNAEGDDTANETTPAGTGSSDDDAHQSAAGEQEADGFLATTGANILVGVLVALVAISAGVWLVLRRRRSVSS